MAVSAERRNLEQICDRDRPLIGVLGVNRQLVLLFNQSCLTCQHRTGTGRWRCLFALRAGAIKPLRGHCRPKRKTRSHMGQGSRMASTARSNLPRTSTSRCGKPATRGGSVGGSVEDVTDQGEGHEFNRATVEPAFLDDLLLLGNRWGQAMVSTVPPSTRNDEPVVALACGDAA